MLLQKPKAALLKIKCQIREKWDIAKQDFCNSVLSRAFSGRSKQISENNKAKQICKSPPLVGMNEGKENDGGRGSQCSTGSSTGGCSSNSSNGETGAGGAVLTSDFTILYPIGEGGFSKVYLAEQEQCKRRFAMKVIEKRRLLASGRVRDSFTEKEVLCRMTHPFIIKLHHTFQSKTKLFFILEHLEGGSLDVYLKRVEGHRLSEPLTQLYTAEMFLALEHLHQNRVVYRDLKPSNVLLDAKGHVCLSDMGLCRIFDVISRPCAVGQPFQSEFQPLSELNANLHRCTSLVGSARFVAPDVLCRQPYGAAVDWWALGILVFVMVAGDYPFPGTCKQELYDNIQHAAPRFHCCPWITPTTREFVTGLLAKSATSRLSEAQIKGHAFFSGVDWDLVLEKAITPPGYLPFPSVTWESYAVPGTDPRNPLYPPNDNADLKIPLPRFTGCASPTTILDSVCVAHSNSTKEKEKEKKKSKNQAVAKGSKGASESKQSLSEAEQRLFAGFDSSQLYSRNHQQVSSGSSVGHWSSRGSSGSILQM